MFAGDPWEAISIQIAELRPRGEARAGTLKILNSSSSQISFVAGDDVARTVSALKSNRGNSAGRDERSWGRILRSFRRELPLERRDRPACYTDLLMGQVLGSLPILGIL